jgi:hypothetical protein
MDEEVAKEEVDKEFVIKEEVADVDDDEER